MPPDRLPKPRGLVAAGAWGWRLGWRGREPRFRPQPSLGTGHLHSSSCPGDSLDFSLIISLPANTGAQSSKYTQNPGIPQHPTDPSHLDCHHPTSTSSQGSQRDALAAVAESSQSLGSEPSTVLPLWEQSGAHSGWLGPSPLLLHPLPVLTLCGPLPRASARAAPAQDTPTHTCMHAHLLHLSHLCSVSPPLGHLRDRHPDHTCSLPGPATFPSGVPHAHTDLCPTPGTSTAPRMEPNNHLLL